MSLNLKHTNYGNQTNNADALIIDISDGLVSFAEFELSTFKPVFITQSNLIENDFNTSLLKALNYFQFTKKKYTAVYINYFTERFTLCPSLFYNEADKKDLLQFNCGDIATDIVLTNDISSTIKIIFSIPSVLKSLLDQTFPNHQLKHSICVLSQLMLNTKDLSNEMVLLNVTNYTIELVVKNNTQLIMANQFGIKTEQDVLYYLLFLLEQHQLNPLTTTVCVTGNIESNSELFLILKKYIANVKLAMGHKNLIFSQIEGMPQHFNYTLLNRLFCE